MNDRLALIPFEARAQIRKIADKTEIKAASTSQEGSQPESLNRIEQGHVAPTTRTVDKIDRALRAAEV